mgnify:CR=1 FL=1
MKVLFVCKGNVGRSQMAEAFYEKYSKNPKVRSAGYAPGKWLGKNLNTTIYVKVCMDEEGIDVRKKISKKVDREMVNWADSIILFDSKKEDWPQFLRDSNKVEIWEIEDPRHGDLEVHRQVKDEIKKRVRALLEKI